MARSATVAGMTKILDDARDLEVTGTDALINIDRDGNMSLGRGVQVEDLGGEVIVYRGETKMWADRQAKVLGNDGREWPQIPILLHLGKIWRGTKLGPEDFDRIVSAHRPSWVERDLGDMLCWGREQMRAAANEEIGRLYDKNDPSRPTSPLLERIRTDERILEDCARFYGDGSGTGIGELPERFARLIVAQYAHCDGYREQWRPA